MKLEVIVQNGEEAIQAENFGADRLELVSAISEGGLTPSYGAMKQVLESVSIPVYVMIRPHSNHYFYQESDLRIMREDIKKVLDLGGTNIVIGALNKDYTIDEKVLESIIDISPKLEITFHRAFDETASVIDSYGTLTQYNQQVKSILTSGGAINCLEGKQKLAELVDESKRLNGPQIMPGAGLNLDNIKEIHKVVDANQYHFGKAVRLKQSFSKDIDKEVIMKIIKEFSE